MAQSIRQRNKELATELWSMKRVLKSHTSSLDLSMFNDDVSNQCARAVLWHVINNITDVPQCQHPDCNNKVKWNRDLPIDISKGQYNVFCSRKCAASDPQSLMKRKHTNIDRYGVEHVFQNGNVNEKRRDTMIQRYGDEHALNNEELKQKFSGTMLDKYGVEHAMQSPTLLRKNQQTIINRYGVTNVALVPEFQKKARLTSDSKYGKDYYVQTEEFKTKAQATSLERYGVEHVSQSIEHKRDRSKTMMERYGVEHALQSSQFKSKLVSTSLSRYGDLYVRAHISTESLAILDSADEFVKFASGKTLIQIANELGVHYVTVYNRATEYNCLNLLDLRVSYLEREMEEFLDAHNIKYVKNDRVVLNGLEVDFLLPEHNVAIEMNGVYWHSDKFRDKNYHSMKYNLARESGINLIQISESDWNNKADVVKRLIKHRVRKSITVFGARNATIKKISANDAKLILDKYHLQGFVSGISYYGSYCNETLCGVMVFGWTRGSIKSRRLELKRWITDGKMSYPGLFSKVFKYAQNDMGFTNVVSFSANDWFTGTVYEKSGFTRGRDIPPSYRYYYHRRLVHCSAFTKNNIRKKFENNKQVLSWLDNGMTEFEIMDNLGIPRVWDSGKIEWIWTRQ